MEEALHIQIIAVVEWMSIDEHRLVVAATDAPYYRIADALVAIIRENEEVPNYVSAEGLRAKVAKVDLCDTIPKCRLVSTRSAVLRFRNQTSVSPVYILNLAPTSGGASS